MRYVDLGSVNGTWLNEERLVPSPILSITQRLPFASRPDAAACALPARR